MPPELVDTHCHLDREPLAGDLDAVLARAQAAGVRRMVTIGTDVASSRQSIALARRHPQLCASVGIHPEDAYTITEPALRAIEELSHDLSVVAIGEVGLDYYHMGAPKDVQIAAFERFVRMSQARDLALVIHCRDAYDDLLRVIRRAAARPVRGVMHCASGPPDFIRQALELGFCISFAGNVTFPNAAPLRELALLVPDDRLLVETDAPFLAPQPVRGKTNEPAYVAHTAAHLAQLRSTTLEHLAAATTANATRLFKLKPE
jgi:TatD DNase family protein